MCPLMPHVGLVPRTLSTGGLILFCWMLVESLAQETAFAAPQTIIGKQLTIQHDEHHVTVKQADRLLIRYRYRGGSHKPYVDRLTAANGVNVLRDAPADHLHHHGLMFAFKVNGVNFWEERPDSGRELHVQWRELRIATVRAPSGQQTDSSELAILREHLRWEQPGGNVLLVEDRLLTIPAAPKGEPCIVTWQSTFTAPKDSDGVTITGSKYFGLGARFLKAMDAGGRFQNANGSAGVEQTNGKRARWCAYTAQPSPRKPVTVAMFDARSNPRHPATWFTMERPFAYLSATLSLSAQPIRLKPADRLTLRYGVVVFDKTRDGKAIDAAYARWQELPTEVRSGTARGLIGRYYAAHHSQRPVAVRIDSAVAFDWSDGSPDDRLPEGRFRATWEGELFVQGDGQFRFFGDAQGDIRVWVDNHSVCEPGKQSPRPVSLEHGFHSIRVVYDASGEHPRVKLLWESNYFPREVVSARYLVHRTEREIDLAEHLRQQPGREVVERYGCARCHKITGVHAAARPAPPLNRTASLNAEYLTRWLRDPNSVRPGTPMPSLGRLRRSHAAPGSSKSDLRDVRAIAAFLRSLASAAALTEPSGKQPATTNLPSGSLNGGRELFHRLGCIACHSPETPTEADAARAPSLADIGAKWSRVAILRFLQAPLKWHPEGRMGDFKLSEMEAADLAAYLSTFRKLGGGIELPEAESRQNPNSPTGSTDRDTNSELLAHGKQLVERYRCAACHDIPGLKTPALLSPPLDGKLQGIAQRGCLKPPRMTSSDEPKQSGRQSRLKTTAERLDLQFALENEDRIAVAEFLKHRPSRPSKVAAQETAKTRMQSHFQCFRCHTRDGIGAELLSKSLLRYLGRGETQRAAAGDLKPTVRAAAVALAPPDLSGVGAKLRPQWLQKILAGTAPSPRPWLTMRMPRFAISQAEQKVLVDRLVAADGIPGLEAPAPPKQMPTDLQSTAVTLMGSAAFSCTHCHCLGRHRPVADTIGPDLSMVGHRISRGWFFRWLDNPARVRPGTPMPAYVRPARAIAGGDLVAQKEVLWKYLSGTPREKMVLAAEPVRMLKVEGSRPLVVQGRVLGKPPLSAVRAVAIGLPGGNSVLFDGGRLAWLGHWKGDFLREVGGHGARHHWVPAGTTRSRSLDVSAPIFYRHKSTGKWTAPAGWRERFGWLDQVSIEGQAVRLDYRLRAPGAENPDSEAGPWVRVSERIEPVPPDDVADGYTRHLVISGLPGQYDAVVQLPTVSAASKLTVGEAALDSLKDSAGVPLGRHPALVAAGSSSTLVIRAGGNTAASWVSPPASVTYPVLQPFTDKSVKAGRAFDPLIKPVHNRAAILLSNLGSGKSLELTVQMAHYKSGAKIAVGPPSEPGRHGPARRKTPTGKRPADVNVPTYVASSALLARLSNSSGVTLPEGFQIRRLPLPEDFLVCGLTFWKGNLMVGGYDGEIRIAEDTDGDTLADRYRYFAGTFDQVNNLRSFDDQLYAATPGAVYRICDRDADEFADSFQILSSAWDWAGHPYDWFFGLARDDKGNLYGATSTPHERPGNIPGHHFRGSVLRITPEGKTKKIGAGTRYNFGWTSNRAGRIYFTGNQGHWNITCTIHQVAEGDHYGFGEPDQSKVKKPVLYVPYPWCRSLTGLVFAESPASFGPFQGHGFAADYNTRRIIRWTLQQVGPGWQGACYPFLDGLDAGPTDMLFGPDGALYIGYMSDGAWYPERPRGGIYKVTFQGSAPFAIREGRVTKDGFAIELTAPADPQSVSESTCRHVHRYFHEYKGIYHSEEIAHEDVPVHKLLLSSDRRTLTLQTHRHLTPRIYHVRLRGLRSASGRRLDNPELYFTLHAVPQ